MATVVVQGENGAALLEGKEAAREVEASRPHGRGLFRVHVAPLEGGAAHDRTACSSAMRSVTSLAEMRTIGTPHPGCVLWPTKYRFSWRGWRLCGRNQPT